LNFRGAKMGNILVREAKYEVSCLLDDDMKMKPGFHLGATVDIPFNDILSLEPGLFITTKGFKYEQDQIIFNY